MDGWDDGAVAPLAEGAHLERVGDGITEVHDLREAQSRSLRGKLFGGKITLGGASDHINVWAESRTAEIAGGWGLSKKARLIPRRPGVVLVRGEYDESTLSVDQSLDLEEGMIIRFPGSNGSFCSYSYHNPPETLPDASPDGDGDDESYRN
jgi:hypothetical protein